MGGVAAVVLAAGKGTRMKSDFPKVIHKICGKPLVAHVIQSLRDANIDDISIVVGHGRELVEQALGPTVRYVYQEQQLGTGHAVLQAKDVVDWSNTVLVVSGDTPLLSADTLRGLLERHKSSGAAVTVLTTFLDDPKGYGRILRDNDNTICGIVEEKDASQQQKAVQEINSGTYCFSGEFLFQGLSGLRPDNAQNEYYLTDLVALAVRNGSLVEGMVCLDPEEILGVNSREQLALAAKSMNVAKLKQLMSEGVTIVDPLTTYIDRDVAVGQDSVILPFTMLEGNTVIGPGCTIGPQTRILNTQVGSGSSVENSVVKEAVIGTECVVGPFAYLRPGTNLAAKVKVGDFVEIKKSYIGEGSKIPHLSYVGDAQVGKNVNIGAGTITCNYDGKNKSETYIKDGAFIGSNTNLVAPVYVGEGAVIAAGSTVTKDVPAKSLGVARSKQVNIENWVKSSADK